MRSRTHGSSAEYDTFLAPAPIERRDVTSADGTRLNVEVYGRADRPTVVLVHGWTCSIAFWNRQLRDLARDFRVVCYDQRGHGASGEPGASGYGIDGLADDLSAVLTATVPPGEKVVLAGHSMGGMTVVGLADRHPEQLRRQVAGAVITNSGVSQFVPRSTLLPLPLPLATVLAPVSAQIIKVTPPGSGTNAATRFLIRYASMSRFATPAEVDFAARIIAACPPKTRAGFAGLFAVLDLDHAVPELDVPTVVIAGRRDRLTPIWHARRLAERLPQLVDLIEVDESGHLSPITAPETVTGAIRRLAGSFLPGSIDLRSRTVDARGPRLRGIA
jgi:pimeloyl-ACP methyl ester carboxylesterase